MPVKKFNKSSKKLFLEPIKSVGLMNKFQQQMDQLNGDLSLKFHNTSAKTHLNTRMNSKYGKKRSILP